MQGFSKLLWRSSLKTIFPSICTNLFEFLKNAKHEIVVSGVRANDMALRLKYAGVEKIKIISDIAQAVEYVGKTANNNITILPTYTALLQINKMKNLRTK